MSEIVEFYLGGSDGQTFVLDARPVSSRGTDLLIFHRDSDASCEVLKELLLGLSSRGFRAITYDPFGSGKSLTTTDHGGSVSPLKQALHVIKELVEGPFVACSFGSEAQTLDNILPFQEDRIQALFLFDPGSNPFGSSRSNTEEGFRNIQHLTCVAGLILPRASNEASADLYREAIRHPSRSAGFVHIVEGTSGPLATWLSENQEARQRIIDLITLYAAPFPPA